MSDIPRALLVAQVCLATIRRFLYFDSVVREYKGAGNPDQKLYEDAKKALAALEQSQADTVALLQQVLDYQGSTASPGDWDHLRARVAQALQV